MSDKIWGIFLAIVCVIGWVTFLAIVCVIGWVTFYVAVNNDLATQSPPVIRYHCDDDTDTTKGVAKGVLTNCKPVVIERRM